MKKETRTERLEVRLTPDERDELMAAANKYGFGSLAPYMRIKALEAARAGQ